MAVNTTPLLRQITAVVLLIVLFLLATAVWMPRPLTARAMVTCSDVVNGVGKNLAAACKKLGQDQLCYVNQAIRIEYRNSNSQPTFAKAGDVLGFDTVKSVTTSGLSLDEGSWGVVLMKLQTNALTNPPTVQPVTFILYGNANFIDSSGVDTQAADVTDTPTPPCSATVTRGMYLRAGPGNNEQAGPLLSVNETVKITKRTADGRWVFGEAQGTKGWMVSSYLKLDCSLNSLPVEGNTGTTPVRASLQSFYLSTGLPDPLAGCQDIPSGGLLVQAPAGKQVTFEVNGVDVTMGSTGIFRASPRGVLIIDIVEGQATIVAKGGHQTVNAGQEVFVPLGAFTALDVSGPPDVPHPITDISLNLATVCKVAQAAGLNVPCDTNPSVTRAVPTRRRPTSTGVACQPTQPGLPCNCNGACDNGESAYTCPQDCGAPAATNPVNCVPQGEHCGGVAGPCCGGLRCLPEHYCAP
jgi:hypothetical protein